MSGWSALARGGPREQPTPEPTKAMALTRPVVLFAAVGALTVALAVAIPFGLKVPKRS